MITTRNPKGAKPKPKAPSKPKGSKRKRGQPAIEVDLDAESPTADAAAKRTDPTDKPLSGLDAAALVLREAGEPLDTKAMIARILERRLWATSGKTPAATIYSAIIREIMAKGSSSRFQKVDRGRFAAAG